MPRSLMVRTIGNGHALHEHDLLAHANPSTTSKRQNRTPRRFPHPLHQQQNRTPTRNPDSRTGVKVFPGKGAYRAKFIPVLPVIYENSELVC